MEARRGKLELGVEGGKGFGQIQWRNHANKGVALWGHGGAVRELPLESGWRGCV